VICIIKEYIREIKNKIKILPYSKNKLIKIKKREKEREIRQHKTDACLTISTIYAKLQSGPEDHHTQERFHVQIYMMVLI
jgi:hypothetical protein